MISHNSLTSPSFISPVSCVGFTGRSGDNRKACKCHNGIVTVDDAHTRWHVRACTHTHTHASSTLKGLRYSKGSCFDTDKGWCYLLQPGKFQNSKNLQGKNNLCTGSKERKPVFSVIFASIQHLCLWAWHLIKKVCSVSEDFQPGLERMQHSPAALYLVCFTVVTLFGLFQNWLGTQRTY